MRTLPAGLQTHLDSRVTTLSWCWKLTRTDGVVKGFTDHDRPLTVGATVYEAAAGFTASAVHHELGLSVANLDVQGALRSDVLTESDLQAGLWDNATVELWRVNWADTTQALLMRKGTIGEVKRGDHVFVAELRGLAHELNQPIGRLYSYSCDTDVGDARCGVNLELVAYKGTGVVSAVWSADRWFTATGLDSFANGWFTNGKITWTSGANNTRTAEVRLHTTANGGVQLELWLPTGSTLAANDAFTIRAGCDKQFGTCRNRFANAVNFRGFPWMPSNDRIIATPKADLVMDGGSLFK